MSGQNQGFQTGVSPYSVTQQQLAQSVSNSKRLFNKWRVWGFVVIVLPRVPGRFVLVPSCSPERCPALTPSLRAAQGRTPLEGACGARPSCQGRDRDRDRSPPGSPAPRQERSPAAASCSSGVSRLSVNAAAPHAARPPATPKTQTLLQKFFPSLLRRPLASKGFSHIFSSVEFPSRPFKGTHSHTTSWHLQWRHRLTFASPTSGSSS